jgi:glycine dehydrogenase subunit 1
LQLNQPVNEVLRKLADYPILGGYDLTQFYPQLGNSLLVCATEMRTSADINHYAEQLRKIMTT